MIQDTSALEITNDNFEESKMGKVKTDKSLSVGQKGAAKITWTPIVVKEAGVLTSAPNYRLFKACNSVGCISLDENTILLFGGKENLKDNELDQTYIFYGSNRVKSINPNDHL